jgi:hypothetical protein
MFAPAYVVKEDRAKPLKDLSFSFSIETKDRVPHCGYRG